MSAATSKIILTIDKSKEQAFMEMLQNFDFGIVQAVRVSDDVDLLEDLPPEFVADLELAAMDDDVSDTVSNEDAFKMFRQWAEE